MQKREENMSVCKAHLKETHFGWALKPYISAKVLKRSKTEKKTHENISSEIYERLLKEIVWHSGLFE